MSPMKTLVRGVVSLVLGVGLVLGVTGAANAAKDTGWGSVSAAKDTGWGSISLGKDTGWG